MAPLRWILLLAGLVFLVVLAAWEMRRSRQARRELSDVPQGGAGAAHGEPELGQLPEDLADRSHFSGAGFGAGAERVMSAVPPVVQLPPEAHAPETEEPEAGPTPAGPVDTPPLGEPDEALIAGAAASLPPEPPAQPQPAPAPPQSALAPEPPTEPAQPAPLRVDWPPDGQRQIIAVRLVAASGQRLSGRSTRQALAACGFLHGRYGIFHQPGADGRALLSCASLSKPGILDPAAMDFQRFAGLSLFTVLPGPLPAAAALDQLLVTGEELAQRLQALLQDEQGHSLDEPRIAQLRDSVRPLSAGAIGEQPAEPTA